MKLLHTVIAASVGLAATPAFAQSEPQAPREDKAPIVVTGQRSDGKTVAMSDWRVAETEHVLVYVKENDKEAAEIARNLETLHFLLSMLLNRVDQADDTIKLSVTMIGDTADFNHLDLESLRWQRGPFPKAFPTELYYDPREDGAVIATTRTDQRVVLQHGQNVDLASVSTNPPDPQSGQLEQAAREANGTFAPAQANEISYQLTARGRLYAAFAQHYLMTYFPAAYPRWYLDGFGEIFSTMTVAPGAVQYGEPPEGFRQGIEWFGRYSLRDVLEGKYLTNKRWKPAWTPFHAWRLSHLLFFSEEWKQPLGRYLAAVAGGARPEEAAKALGDLSALETAWNGYRGAKIPIERMTFPAERIGEPVVRRLTRDQADYVRGRLVLASRVEIPPTASPGADSATVARMEKARAKALSRRADWLGERRRDAARADAPVEAQLLLAEGACRSGDHALCISAADRALAALPNNPVALSWKGIALAQQASAGPAGTRAAQLKEARRLIARANRANTEAVLPLLAYYRSYADAAEAAPDAAVAGLMKANDSVPSSPATGVALGGELARRGEKTDARRILRPIAHGAYESPERPKAQELLEKAKE